MQVVILLVVEGQDVEALQHDLLGLLVERQSFGGIRGRRCLLKQRLDYNAVGAGERT